MNGAQNAPMGGSWHARYPPEDRQKVVNVLTTTLMQMMPTQYNELKARAEADSFEKAAFQRAVSKEDYMNYVRKKVVLYRERPRANEVGQMPLSASSAGRGNGINGGNGMNGINDINGGNGSNTGNNGQSTFYPQDRSQTMPQMQNQQNQGNQAAANMQLPNQQQQAQIANIVRTGPIPPQILAKMPMLPPNVNTWPQVYECVSKKLIPQSATPLIKELHAAHISLAVRQHQQQQQQKLTQLRKMSVDHQPTVNLGNILVPGYGNNNTNSNSNANTANNMSAMGMNINNVNNMPGGNGANNMGMNPSGANNANNSNMNMSNSSMNNNMGMNNMNNIGNSLNNNNNNNMNRMGANNAANSRSTTTPQKQNVMMQQGNYLNNKQQPKPQMPTQNMPAIPQQQLSQTPNQQAVAKLLSSLTKEEFEKYSREAMLYLAQLQLNGTVLQNLDQTQKQMFIRKFILQYKLKQNAALNANMNMQNKAPQQNMNMIGNFGNQQQHQMGQQQLGQQNLGQQQQQQMNQQMGQQINSRVPSNNNNNTNNMGMGNMGNAPNVGSAAHSNNMIGVNPQQVGNNMANQNLRAAKMNSMLQNAKPVPQQGYNGAPNQNRPSSGPLLPPLTEEMKLQLQSIGAEVAQKNPPLKDLTLLLSDQEKIRVKEILTQLAHQYQNVDNILSYFCVLTSGNSRLDGARRLLQLKVMTKSIYDSLRQGIYLASPALLERMRLQYQKFTDYVKERVLAQKAQQESANQQQQQPPQPAQQQQQQQQQPQPLQQPPLALNQGNNVIPQQGKQQQNPQQIPPGMRNNMNQFGQNNQQFVQQGMQQLIPGGYNGAAQQTAPVVHHQQMAHGAYQQKPLPQTMQNNISNHGPPHPRNIPNQAIASQKGRSGNAQASRIGSSPIPISAAGSPIAMGPKLQQYKPAPAKKAVNSAPGRRKNVKPTSAIPTPASAPTPATLANAIKTPNNIPTPLLPLTQSNKGTPNDLSPTNELKLVVLENEPLIGDVFGKNSTDSRIVKRREMSISNPEKFFFSALSNLLELGDDGENAKNAAGDFLGALKSPLSPKNGSDWTAEIKPFAIISAFRQVDAIRDLTSSDILAECADIVQSEMKAKLEQGGIKRELDEDEDLELLFFDKKFKTDDGLDGEIPASLVGFDDWKSWLTKLQET